MSLMTDTFILQDSLKCMMRSDTLDWHDYGGYKEMTALYWNIYSTDEGKSKRITLHKSLSQSCSTNEDESKQSIVNKNLLQNDSADIDELCSAMKVI